MPYAVGDLWITCNGNLTSLTGLDNLTSIVGQLGILDNASLKSLNSLERITSVGNALRIVENDVLTDLTGLHNVTSVWTLRIERNKALTSVGLYNLNQMDSSLAII